MRHRTTTKVMVSALLAAVAITPTTATANAFCADINEVLVHAQTNFLDHTGKQTPASALPLVAETNECAVSLTLSGRNAYHCAQRFDYRVDEARAVFERYDTALRSCLANLTQAEQDLGVNHPDSYDLRTYEHGNATLSLSLKDKGALQATYVFVRVSGAATE